jgi:hypothetical protein
LIVSHYLSQLIINSLVSKNIILQKLSPFQNFKKVLVSDQSTKDIVNGIIDTHYQYENEYDKISRYFLGNDVKETAKNVWEFLKNNVPYFIESGNNQTLRSPSAIVSMPGDCKSYALFTNGVFQSLNKKGYLKVPIAFRFASYKNNSKEPGHVFAVLYPGTNKEIWVDPVLDRFDDRSKIPTYYKDKKTKMSLVQLSGVEYTAEQKQSQMTAYRNKLVSDRDRLLNSGVIKPGSSKELEYKVAINKVTQALQNMPQISGFFDGVTKLVTGGTNAATKVADLTNPVKIGLDAVTTLLGLFSNKPNPRDWEGWDAMDRRLGYPFGTGPINWVINDGDSIQNEALNIVSWIRSNGLEPVLQYNSHFGRAITIDQLADKLRRGGFPQEAQAFKDEFNKIKPGGNSGGNSGGDTPTKQAGMNIALTLGLAAGAFLLVKQFAKK